MRNTIPRDFTQVWYAARTLLAGQDPYALIGPGRAFEWPWPFFYPLPAAVAAIPLTPLPAPWAGALFMAIGGACFAWALMEYGYPPLLGFLSGAMVTSIETVQWSPLMAAALVLSPLGFFYAAKPTIGAALFLARPGWWPVIGGLVLAAIAFVFLPSWASEWRQAFVRGAAIRPLHFTAPILQPGGILALLSLLRWRRPEARLIAALACVPQTTILYETLPLSLVPRTLPESAILLVLSYVSAAIVAYTTSSWTEAARAFGQWLWILYAPATLMVLRRPNEGPVPVWLERATMRWPAWLRGRAVARA